MFTVAPHHGGEIVTATAGRSEHISDDFHAEMNVVIQAVSLTEQLAAIHVVLETDSQLLMVVLNN